MSIWQKHLNKESKENCRWDPFRALYPALRGVDEAGS